MAEGWINSEIGVSWEARSAGTRPANVVHPLAVRVMAEVGIDISGGVPNDVTAFLDQDWDLVVTVCDSAKETCPVFPQPVETIHRSFFDPAEAEGTEDEIMTVFRTVRDAIHDQLLPELRDRTA
jgi:arsenate reductase